MKYNKHLIVLISIFALFGFTKGAHATQYYIDCTSGNNASAGTATGTAWLDIDQFTDNARSAGDIATVRRGGTACDDGTDLTFTSDGTVNSPITLEADYNNYWGDFASSSQTYTVTRGSREITASGAITDIAVSNWIYVTGEDQRQYAYEVATVSGTQITLFFPYEGNKPGTGLTLNIMPNSPVWSTNAATPQWTMAADNWWRFYSFNVRSTNSSCAITLAQNMGTFFKDMRVTGDGVTDCGFQSNTSGGTFMYNSRFKGQVSALNNNPSFSGRNIWIDCNSVASSNGINDNGAPISFINATNITIVNCTTTITTGTQSGTSIFNLRNFNSDLSTLKISGTTVNQSSSNVYLEDDLSHVGSSSFASNLNDTSTLATSSRPFTRTLSNLRSGGGLSNIKILPPGSPTGNTGLSANNFPFSYFKLFEYPVYTNTSQTTVNVFFKPDNTASWSANPTATQLYIEADIYASSSGAFRYLKKSTGTINFTGSSAWQSIPITFIASQSGVAYIRAYYGKPKEAVGTSTADANLFYVDTKPDITQP